MNTEDDSYESYVTEDEAEPEPLDTSHFAMVSSPSVSEFVVNGANESRAFKLFKRENPEVSQWLLDKLAKMGVKNAFRANRLCLLQNESEQKV